MVGLHGLEPEQLARIGMFYLEEAILDVLHAAKHNQEWLPPTEISETVGILPAVSRRLRGIKYPIVRGILDKLQDEGRVKPSTHEKGENQMWQLTEEEFEKRCDD